MNAVRVSDLRKDFRRRNGRRLRRERVPALHDVSFTIERGECVAFLGQNGSGKSTLVRLLSTLLLADGGTASVFGHEISNDPRAVRRSSTASRSRPRSSRRCPPPRTSRTRRASTG